LGEKDLLIWSHNEHEGGGILDDQAALEFFGKHLRT
jgi:hypothetical protein